MASVSSNIRRATDPRPARTRASILDAIQRLGARGAELTISTIVAEAGLSRSSFYSQFKDLGDVAVQLFEALKTPVIAVDAEQFNEKNSAQAAVTSYRLITAELQRHRALYAAVLSAKTTYSTHQQLCIALAAMIDGPARRTAPEGTDPETASLFIAAGTLALLISWLHSENPAAEDEIHQQLLSLLPPWIITPPAVDESHPYR